LAVEDETMLSEATSASSIIVTDAVVVDFEDLDFFTRTGDSGDSSTSTFLVDVPPLFACLCCSRACSLSLSTSAVFFPTVLSPRSLSIAFRSVYNISSIDLPSYSTSIEEEGVLIGAAGVSIGTFDEEETGVSRAFRLTFDSVLLNGASETGGAVLDTPRRLTRVLIPEGTATTASGGGADAAPTFGGVAGDEVEALSSLNTASGDLLRVEGRSGVVTGGASERVEDLDRPPPVMFEIKPPTTLKTPDIVAIGIQTRPRTSRPIIVSKLLKSSAANSDAV
jgi:hypothetical protein